ncbi:porin [Gemmobacter fulvus]|uniref:Porin n=1 Tax=Gemmobacter fulvus TaxID=2840474 RepID=A0A975P4G7_9RHOB|nr:porin [Gemmobacter fulvus]MBT9247173.1 porin [Gemmobacter fulvus]QWK88953.1 porin [Gemmobacter fulvus]
MKNILLATTILASVATVASAETGVSISGYGRFGLVYDGSADDVVTTNSTTTIHTRLRFNIDATTETDSGVTFGGRIRMQHSSGSDGADLSAAMLFATYEGLRVEVGNANTAYDSVALMYDPEMGFVDSSFGDPQGNFFAFNSGPNPTADYMGVFASYSMGGFTGRISAIDPDQTTSVGAETEVSVSFDYTSGPFTVALAAVQDGEGIADNDQFFVGAAYAINDAATVGLNYVDEGEVPVVMAHGGDQGRTITLYGNYTMGATTLRAYVADNDYAGNVEDTSFGIGADYDLGGARLSGSIQRGYEDETVADLGVRFDF